MNRDGQRWEPEPEPDVVQAYHEVTPEEVLTGLRAAEVLEGATMDPRREVAHETLSQDIELRTGERFRVMVQRLRY